MYNGHGDVTNLLDGKGNVIGSYYYDDFGNIKESTGSFKNPYRYSGYQYDEEIGKYYLMSRMYDPESARFMQEDTYRGNPNDPLSLNLYTYCHNEPLMYSDPSGHWRISNMFSGISNFFSKAYDTITDCVSTVCNTISSAYNYVNNKVESFKSNAKDYVLRKSMTFSHATVSHSRKRARNNNNTSSSKIKLSDLVEGVKATSREVIEDVGQVAENLSDIIPKVAKFVGGAISLGAGVAATAAGAALVSTGVGAGFGLGLIGAGVTAGAYGLGEIG